jgi:hypothetical protein
MKKPLQISVAALCERHYLDDSQANSAVTDCLYKLAGAFSEREPDLAPGRPVTVKLHWKP